MSDDCLLIQVLGEWQWAWPEASGSPSRALCQRRCCVGAARCSGCWKLCTLSDALPGSAPWSAVMRSVLSFIIVFPFYIEALHTTETKSFFFLSIFFSFSYCDFGSDSKKLIHCVGLHCNLQPAHSIPRFRFQLSPAASTFSWQLFWLLHPKNAPDIKSAGATHGLEHVSENFTHCIVVALAYFTSNGNLVFMRTLIFLPFRCLLKSLNVDFSM